MSEREKWILKCHALHYPYYRGPGKTTRWSGKQAEAKRYITKAAARTAVRVMTKPIGPVRMFKLVPRKDAR